MSFQTFGGIYEGKVVLLFFQILVNILALYAPWFQLWGMIAIVSLRSQKI
jgi:hypothetical protein